MCEIDYLDRPAAGWHALDVMREKSRSPCWVALLIDMDPEEFVTSSRKCRHQWLRIPGKHKNSDAAWEALQNVMATRH